MKQIKSNHFYRIEIKGRLDERWSDWFEGFSLTHTDDDSTLLTGPVKDQAALHGILKKINHLGLTLISVLPQERKS